jgi:integrase
MSIKRENDKWVVDVKTTGNKKRYRRVFEKKTEAVQFEQWILNENRNKPDWQPVTADKRQLSELVERWFTVHGLNLRYSTGRLRILLNLCNALGNPMAHQFRAGNFLEYRQERMAAGITANTLNHELSYLKAVFNRLIKIGEWTGSNPLRTVDKLLFRERELSFLSLEEVKKLLAELERGRNKDALLAAKVCLATGARWSEVMSLSAATVGKERVTFLQTKNNEPRTIPMSQELCAELRMRLNQSAFSSCESALRHGMSRCQFRLPRGQKIHVLRHTFASHFVMNNGNLLTLQKILGHRDIKITLRYAHLAPEFLNSALLLNPIALLKHQNKI